MQEQWKIIPFEINYEVSNKGRVRNSKTEQVKSDRFDRYGYKRVTLYPSGKTYTVHRLVGLIWLADTYQEGLQIAHLDADRTNNCVINLEWVTSQENTRRIKDRGDVRGEKNPLATISEELAYKIKYSFELTAKEAESKFKVTESIVEKIRARTTWTHVVDPDLEEDFTSGKKKYARGRMANLSDEESHKLTLDLLSDMYTVPELTKKYGVTRSTIHKRKRKLLVEGSTTIPKGSTLK